MSSVAPFAALLALGVIVLIGLDLLMRVPKRREDSGVRAAPVVADGDPVNLRRRRPLTQRLSGAVLIVAAVVLYLVIHPLFGL